MKTFIACLCAVLCLLIAGAAETANSARASEYEMDGTVDQLIIRNNGNNLTPSASFTAYVRGSNWMFKITETNEHGNVFHREVGSINGTEICECVPQKNSSGPFQMTAQIESNNIPVGQLDAAVIGHLWIMLASQTFWPTLNSDQVKPVYDWQASVAAHGQNRRVSAEWELLAGPGSLPREVRYLGYSNETNAIYTVTGTNVVDGRVFPSGFIFEQRRRGASRGNRFEMTLVKRVTVNVTAVRPACSLESLIPLPVEGTHIIDLRFEHPEPNHLPSYRITIGGRWPSVEEAKKLAHLDKPPAAGALAPAPLARMPWDAEPNLGPTEVSLAIRCTNEVVRVGDEIAIEFRITNRGTNGYKYSDRTYDRSGRMNEYKLEAKTEAGQSVPDPRADARMFFTGGLSQYKVLEPGESYTKVIALNRWALVKTPGRYQVLGTYSGPLNAKADPITITVLPRTEAELNAYINQLTDQLEAKIGGIEKETNRFRPTDETVVELMMKLMYTCNSNAVPGLLNGMYTDGGNASFWADEALRYYVPRTPEIKKALLAAANARGLAGNMPSLFREFDFTKEELRPIIESALASDNEPQWSAGASLAAQFGDAAFAPRLIAIAMDQKSSARTAAISALVYSRTDEVVKTLKALLDDPHERIWVPLASAIQNALNSTQEEPVNDCVPDDLTAQDVKPLIGRLLSQGQGVGSSTALQLIEQFGGDDYTAQVIAIATDPAPKNYYRNQAIEALALNRSDDGVKTLKALLKDPDPQIRNSTEDALRHAYNDRGKARGKPLKMEDFDKKYQQQGHGGQKITGPMS